MTQVSEKVLISNVCERQSLGGCFSHKVPSNLMCLDALHVSPDAALDAAAQPPCIVEENTRAKSRVIDMDIPLTPSCQLMNNSRLSTTCVVFTDLDSIKPTGKRHLKSSSSDAVGDCSASFLSRSVTISSNSHPMETPVRRKMRILTASSKSVWLRKKRTKCCILHPIANFDHIGRNIHATTKTAARSGPRNLSKAVGSASEAQVFHLCRMLDPSFSPTWVM